MEIGKKSKKKDVKPYQHFQTVTESSQLNQAMGCEPFSNLNLKPKRVDSLKLETTQIQQSTLPVLSRPISQLVTSRRSRRKIIPKLTSNKNMLSSSKSKTRQQTESIKHVVNITDLIRLFFEKAGRNSPYREPVSYDPYEKEGNFTKNQFILKIENIHIPKMVQNIYIATEVVFIIIYIFAFPLAMLFQEVRQSGFFLCLKVFGLLFCMLDILKLCRSVPQNQKHSVSRDNFEKSVSLIKTGIIIQLIIIFFTIISLVLYSLDIEQSSFFFIAMILNIKPYLNQICKLQDHFFKVTHHEKYWDLVKVIGMNLIVCHILACILIGITFISPEESWMATNRIIESPWWQQYIWSYYFGTTIILTIGFGDLHPVNHVQAFFIIIISFCACLFFGYNINYIGNLINLINQEEVEKNSKLKIFNLLAKRTSVSSPTSKQITNYIVQSSKIRQQFNFAQERQLIQELPDGLKSSFLAEANLKLFTHFRTLIVFSNKTIERLSLNIQAKICHPDQVIKRATQPFSIMILQSGEVGFVANRKNSRLHGLIIERISNTIDQQAKLICADILQNEALDYDIKSLAYSTVYTMEKHTFQDCVKQSKDDYEVYRQALDACKFKLNQYRIVKCRYCDKQHTLFECPKLHFCPFKKSLPLKKFNSSKIQDKQKRVKFLRNKPEVNYYDFSSALTIEQSLNFIGLSNQKNIQNQTNVPHNRVSNGHRGSFKHPRTRESFLLATEMVTKLRQDIINNLKVSSTDVKFEFTLWDATDCDEVYDFKYYFPRYNSSQLDQKYSLLHSRNHKKKWLKRFM